ncbi:hypothetical protein [Niallia taxi]|uniref:hypothetical protein n=1 Tax=Niallia taxi TaxID=2499688 RepID=UPI003D2B8E96
MYKANIENNHVVLSERMDEVNYLNNFHPSYFTVSPPYKVYMDEINDNFALSVLSLMYKEIVLQTNSDTNEVILIHAQN